jgi:amino acid transporter
VSTVRRRIRVRGGNLGWFLCWAVVIADVGTSTYYTPGILYGPYGTRSGIFVCMTLGLFLLLALKYSEVTWRFPEGGGVVNVSATALHQFAGLLGGLFILVDYYLTIAISALSGLIYLSVVVPRLEPVVVVCTLAALAGMGILNLLGIRESARTTAVVAAAAVAGQVAVVAATVLFLKGGFFDSFAALGHGPSLGPLTLVRGYAGAVLAFSGLETISQLAPAMRQPRRRVAYRAMGAVALTMAVTSPLLTIWSTTLLQGTGANPNQFISLLGARVGGAALGVYVATTGALLLVFASNTGVIGAYHVLIALARMGFLPRLLDQRNRWRQTPHWAILLAVGLPVAVVVLSRGDLELLGDLYAFGLLGAFILTCISLDVVRWREYGRQWSAGRVAFFALGLVTTGLVAVAWLTNLVAKPLATEFGGGLTVLGLVVGGFTYARRRPVILPFRHHPEVPVMLPTASRAEPSAVLAVIPDDLRAAEAVVATAIREAAGRPLIFLYRGRVRLPAAELLEVADPYLRDRSAQAAFAHAERAARGVRDRRYVYLPADGPEAVAGVWRAIRPRETVLAQGDEAGLPPIALDRVRLRYVDGLPILHLISGRPLRERTS